MKKYITLLIQDIQKAARPFDSIIPEEDEVTEQDYFAEVEAFLEFEEESGPAFKEICGLDAEAFPPVEHLDKDEILAVVDAFDEMLMTWNITCSVPVEIEPSLKYTLMVSMLEEHIYIVDEGQIGWDFCVSDIETCPLGEHCTCIEYEEEFERDLKEARLWIKDFKKTMVMEFKNMGKWINYSLGDSDTEYTGKMCEFIGGGIPDVPFYVSQNVGRFDAAIKVFISLLDKDSSLYAVFMIDDFWVRFEALQQLMSMNASHPTRGNFVIEPFYVSDGKIFLGQEPSYSVDDFVSNLENGEIDIEGDEETDHTADHDPELPF